MVFETELNCHKEGEKRMLTGLNVAVIGGDARQLEVIRRLSEHDANLFLIGFDQLEHGYTGSKINSHNISLEGMDAVILPVSGTGSEGQVEAVFSAEEIVLTREMVASTPEHCIFYSGMRTKYLEELMEKEKRKLVPILDRDDVAIYNSIPTVEGTIMLVIQHTDFTIHGSNIAVIGFGRTGMSVARTFAALGANVKVGARKQKDLARITEMGMKPFHLSELKDELSSIDICINTVPALVLSSDVLAAMPVHALIIDLASKPGGTDFHYAEKRGMKAILAPGLPGIVAPKTAGQILANALTILLTEQHQLERSMDNGSER